MAVIHFQRKQIQRRDVQATTILGPQIRRWLIRVPATRLRTLRDLCLN